VDPFKLVPASYFPYIISALFTAFTGLAGWVVRKLFKVAAEELKTAKDSLTKLNTEIVLQRTNHLHHIEENTAKTVTLLEAWSKEQQETNGYLRAIADTLVKK
jgi:hypothetical protein